MSPLRLDTQATIDDLLEIMRKRRSCRRYLPDPVPDETVQKILEAGRWAPSGCSSEPWELILVRDAEMRARFNAIYCDTRRYSEEVDIGPHGFPFPDLSYLYKVPVYIVVAGDRRLAQTYPLLYYRYDIYQQSMAACIQNMFLAAAAQGLGATWLSMGRKMEHHLLELFEVPEGYRIETILAVGWPDLKVEIRERRPIEDIVHFDRFDSSRARTEEEVLGSVREIREKRRIDRDVSGEMGDSGSAVDA